MLGAVWSGMALAAKWVVSRTTTMGTWAVNSVDPTVKTVEVRLIAFGLFVLTGLGLLVLEIYYSNPHRINNIALGTMATACWRDMTLFTVGFLFRRQNVPGGRGPWVAERIGGVSPPNSIDCFKQQPCQSLQ